MATQKVFDLEDRTLSFSKKCLVLVKTLNFTPINKELTSQFIRSSTSIGANYREANDALGKKDFLLRIRICRKEAKETVYWLELLLDENPRYLVQINKLNDEAKQFVKIFSAILNKMS